MRHAVYLFLLFAHFSGQIMGQCIGTVPAGYAVARSLAVHVIHPDCSFQSASSSLLLDVGLENVRVFKINNSPENSSVRPLSFGVAVKLEQELLVWPLITGEPIKIRVLNPSDIGGDYSQYLAKAEGDCGNIRIGSVVTGVSGEVSFGLVRKALPSQGCAVNVVKPQTLSALVSLEVPTPLLSARIKPPVGRHNLIEVLISEPSAYSDEADNDSDLMPIVIPG